MGEPGSKASDPERRASVRTSRGVSLYQEGSNALPLPLDLDLDLDENDLYSMLALGGGMVADGYRPGTAAPVAPTNDYHNQYTPSPVPVARSVSPDSLRSLSEAPSSPSPPSTPRPNRSSISKPPRGRDSFTLRHDGAMGHVGAAGPSMSRFSTASSESPYVVTDGPYQGPTAPSHSYQMYPQQSTRPARTLSIATTSTTPAARPESEYNGPRGPSHPYSMYPQNPVEETNPQPPVPAIPVGFNGAGAADPYQRRLGPEGEEIAGIIGPDGHTEELPPYTRYPDEMYARKIRATEQPQEPAAGMVGASSAAAAPVAITTLANVAPSISGAGGIGLAARNPEFDAGSVNDATSPQSRHSSRSFMSESHHEINTAAATVSEKPQLNKYQRFARRKACGVVPYWSICLTVSAIVIVVIIIAAVIGTLLSHRHKPPSGSSPTKYQDSVPTVTVTFDATPIPTPSDLPALAQGTFGLPMNLNQAPDTCFNDTSQTSAWSCNIAFPLLMSMQLTITRNAPQLGKDGTYDVVMMSNTSNSPDPDSDGDSNSLNYGASAPVIMPAMNMELVNDTFDLDRGPAWFRMLPYNKTVLVQEELLSASTSSSNKRYFGGFNSKGNFQRKGVAEEGERPWLCTWPDTFVEMFIYAEQNSSYAAASTATITTAPSTASATAAATGSGSTATSSGSTEVISMSHMTAYPRAIKVKERRVSQSPSPYCVQVLVQADNTTVPVLDSDGNEVVINIDEIEESNGMKKRDSDDDDDDDDQLSPRSSDEGDMSDCGCMWFAS